MFYDVVSDYVQNARNAALDNLFSFYKISRGPGVVTARIRYVRKAQTPLPSRPSGPTHFFVHNPGSMKATSKLGETGLAKHLFNLLCFSFAMGNLLIKRRGKTPFKQVSASQITIKHKEKAMSVFNCPLLLLAEF